LTNALPALARVEGFPVAGGVLDVVVRRGEVVRIVGPNGSGKTSLLRAFAGLDATLRPRSADVAGADPARVRAAHLARLASLVPQDARDGLVGLTAAGEARLRGVACPSWAPADRASTTLSSGEARRLVLALAQGALWLLDEPTEALDAAGRPLLCDLVEAQRRRGAVIVVDPSGTVRADRDIVLAPTAEAQTWRLPAPPEGPRLVADACALTLGAGHAATTVVLGAVAFGPGFHAVTGPNGSGKTTLLRRLAGLVTPAAGAGARLDGEPAAAGPRLRWLGAEPSSWATEDSVAGALAHTDPAVVAALVPRALLPRHPWALSGGEARRCGLARALGSDADVVLLDEPEAFLDAEARARLGEVIADGVARGAVIIAATHDDAVAAAAHTVTRMEAR
jgi:ABC-type transport system involved in cytochrome c biogenesis ATPase subunit